MFNFDSVNIQKQMDAPFLLSESAGEVARFFNSTIWLECGRKGPKIFDDPSIPEGYYPNYHDIELDCGGATFEEAIVNLANLVEKNL